MHTTLAWFEIPTLEFERAKSFYEHVLDGEIKLMESPETLYGFLPFDPEKGGVSGSIVADKNHTPSPGGPRIYIDAGNQMELILSRVAPAGGKVLLPKTDTGGNGFFALFEDTEGNQIGLHSQ